MASCFNLRNILNLQKLTSFTNILILTLILLPKLYQTETVRHCQPLNNNMHVSGNVILSCHLGYYHICRWQTR